MNSGVTSERVYDALKRRILIREFRPGERLDPAALSETLASSVTPVRDCLNTLRGEHLVESRSSEGFFLPHIDAPALRDLYAWNADILLAALRRWPRNPGGVDPGRPVSPSITALADATAAIFALAGRRSPNIEDRRAIGAANDRLHAVRTAEAKALEGGWTELTALQLSVARGEAGETRRLISTYHRRRRRAVDQVIHVLYRNGDR